MYIFVVKELLKLIWFSIIKKLLPMSQNTCYLSPQSIHPLVRGGGMEGGEYKHSIAATFQSLIFIIRNLSRIVCAPMMMLRLFFDFKYVAANFSSP
jgi:hypothetical protein